MAFEYLNALCDKKIFSRSELFEAMNQHGLALSEAMFKVRLQKLLNDGKILRVGRNAYAVNSDNKRMYNYDYSEVALSVAGVIEAAHPSLAFSIFESIQLNEFINHQIAHNAIFVSVEGGLESFVFETLKEAYPGKVLLSPSSETFHLYWTDGLIVIGKLVTEAPLSKVKPWHTRLEKLLVDLLAEPLLLESISPSEYPAIFEEAFRRYAIDESQMFRYARRRGAYARLLQFMEEKTNIELRVV